MPDQITTLVNYQTVPDSEVYASRVDIVGTGKVDLVSPPPGVLLYPGTVGKGEGDPGGDNKNSLFIANGDSANPSLSFKFYLNNGEEDLPLNDSGSYSVNAGDMADVTGVLEAWEGGIPAGYTLKVQMGTPGGPVTGRVLFVGSFSRVSLNKDETR